jgi:plasmid stabilization system protein ParE
MVKLTIFWTEVAIKQRDLVFAYWIERNKSNTYSKALNAKINERISQLTTNPKLGKKTNFEYTRVVSLEHYSIFYKKMNFKIIITGFWDNRQDPEKLLLLLTKNKI